MEGGGSFILCHSVSLGHCPIGEACLAPAPVSSQHWSSLPCTSLEVPPTQQLSEHRSLTGFLLRPSAQSPGLGSWCLLSLASPSPSPLGPARLSPGSSQGPCPCFLGALGHQPSLVFVHCFWLSSEVSPPLPPSLPLDRSSLDPGTGRDGLCAFHV